MQRVGTLAALALALPIAMAPAAADDHRTPISSEAAAYFIAPTDGQTVSSPFLVQFGASGIGIAPAGVQQEGTGHHHVLIDTEYAAFDEPIPVDDNHRHFGGGQTETVLDLPPGEYTLQLLMGDHDHMPHAPPVMSSKITITVE